MANRERMRGGQSQTKGRICAAWAFGLLVLTAAGAGETTWIGPAEGGSWHEVGNWSAGVPTADSIVQIDVKGEMTISAASGKNAALRSLRATGEGTLTLAQSGNGLSFGKDADGRCGVDVAPGVTVVSLMSFQSASQNLLPHFVKTGEGLLVLGDGTVTPAFGRYSGGKFAGADVAGGTLRINFEHHTDGFDPGKPAILHVGAGATLDVTAVRVRTTGKTPTAHDAHEALALGSGRNVDICDIFEDIDRVDGAGICLVRGVSLELAQNADGRLETGLGSVADFSLREARGLLRSPTELDSLVAIFVGSFDLDDGTRARLDDRDGDADAVLVPNLGHPDFLSDQALHGMVP